MGIFYDLHSHSTASDGTLEPGELVRAAVAAEVDVLALTDHDTVAGIADARAVASTEGLQLVAGVEISVTWCKQTVHILGLQVDPENSELLTGLQSLQHFRAWRAEEIGARLAKNDIADTYTDALALARGGLVSRTHFARVLVQRGYGKSMQAIFKRYLVPNKPGHVSGRWAELEQALAWITGAGGVAVIAHPARYRMSRTKLMQLTGEFHECGGAAIEVVSGSHSADDVSRMAKLAEQLSLYASQGSDYHGPDKPWVQLGRLRTMPERCTPVWASRQWQDRVGIGLCTEDHEAKLVV